MKIQAITTIEGFVALRQEWQELEQKLSGKSPYQTWDWQQAWIRTKHVERYLHILVVRDADGRLIGVAPLQRARALIPGLSILVFVGQESSISPDFLLAPGTEDAVLQQILGYVAAKQRILGLVLRVVAYGYSSHEVLTGILGKRSMAYSNREYSECVSLRLPASYDDFIAGLGSRMRQEMRAARRALEREHVVDFSVDGQGKNFELSLAKLLELNDARWGKSGGRGLYETLYPALLQTGMLKIVSLNVDGKPAAALSILVLGDSLFAELAGFDYDVESRHLGRYFYGKVVEWAIENGFGILDLSSGDEQYKRRFKPEIFAKYRVVCSSSAFRYKLIQLVRRIGARYRWLRVVSLS